VLHLPDSNSVAVFSYASGAVGNWLFIIDSDTLGFQRYDVPNNCRISHGAALGSDGNI
jgi:hypothetical protein